jgi:protein O-GlcNAc transferase
LRTVGLAQLITESSLQYEDRAVELATEPARLAELRALLARSRSTAALFDTERYTRNLEAAFEQIYDQYHSDAPPCHINEHLAT